MKKILYISKMAFSAITKNSVRSFLSVLGIAIGIAAVIAMLGLGNGAQASIQDSISSLGSNTISLSTSSSRTPGIPSPNGGGPGGRSNSTPTASVPITQSEYAFLSTDLKNKISNIDQVAGESTETIQLQLSPNNLINTELKAVTPNYFSIQNLEIDYGKNELSSNSPQIIIGSSLATQVFDEQKLEKKSDLVGKNLSLNNQSYQIVGVLKETDSLLLATANSVVYTSSDYYFSQNPNRAFFSGVTFSVKNLDQIGNTKDEIRTELRNLRGLTGDEKDNFSLTTVEDLAASISQITNIVTLLLSGISGISLLVGGIGISNIMLVSVTERTKEIGLRKAIGAKRGYILWQFLIEALFLTLIGGFVGVLVGYGLGFGVGQLLDFNVVIKPENIILATGISSFIGVFFGFVPAWNASRLSPVDALRYE